MPTYEYQCESCGGHFDIFQSIKDAPKETCEKCGGRLTKLLSAGSGLIFKGSGFYITDYKGGSGSSPAASSGEGSAPKQESTAAPKTESKSNTESSGSNA